MKKYLSLLVVLLTTLFAANSLAYTPPPAPQQGWYVSDQAGKLTPNQINQLNQKIERVNKATKNEFGILLLQDMGGDNIEDVANTTFKSWGVGKRGLDNGCLIVVAIKERKSRIETGKGVEGEVTDLQASDILRKNLNPHLKQGDFAGGFNDTLDALSSLIESRHNQKADPPPNVPPMAKSTGSSGCSVGEVGSSDDTSGLTMAAVIVGIMGLLLGLRAWSKYRQRKETERLQQEAEDLAAENKARAILIEQDRVANEQHARLIEEETRRRAAESVHLIALEEQRRKTLPPPPSARPSSTPKKIADVAIVAAATAAVAATALKVKEQEDRRRQEREEARQEAERAARREEEREEERRQERNRRKLEETLQDSSSDDSSSSSSDWGSSSSSDDDDSGSGFGGGDSGGGGSDSDF